MHPILIKIGPLAIPTYGFFVALGVLAALTFAEWRAKGEEIEKKRVFDLGITIIIASLVGSKLILFSLSPGAYIHSWSEVVTLLRSGGVFYGGFLAGILAGLYLVKRHGLPLWKVADIYGNALPLGQAIGRLGCFSAGCCWGKACSLPWAVTFHSTTANAITGVPLATAIHPTQIYHSLTDLGLFFLMTFLYRRKRFDGQIFWSYALSYAAIRFVIEFWRGDPRGFPFNGPLSTSQVIAMSVAILASFMLIRGYRSLRRA